MAALSLFTIFSESLKSRGLLAHNTNQQQWENLNFKNQNCNYYYFKWGDFQKYKELF